MGRPRASKPVVSRSGVPYQPIRAQHGFRQSLLAIRCGAENSTNLFPFLNLRVQPVEKLLPLSYTYRSRYQTISLVTDIFIQAETNPFVD